jgi:hypothetical protein
VIFYDPEQGGKRPRLGAEGENGIPHCQSKETLTILDEWLWLIEGSLSEDSIPDMYRDGLREYGGRSFSSLILNFFCFILFPSKVSFMSNPHASLQARAPMKHENMPKCQLGCHSGESRNPSRQRRDWMPYQVRQDGKQTSLGVIQDYFRIKPIQIY